MAMISGFATTLLMPQPPSKPWVGSADAAGRQKRRMDHSWNLRNPDLRRAARSQENAQSAAEFLIVRIGAALRVDAPPATTRLVNTDSPLPATVTQSRPFASANSPKMRAARQTPAPASTVHRPEHPRIPRLASSDTDPVPERAVPPPPRPRRGYPPSTVQPGDHRRGR